MPKIEPEQSTEEKMFIAMAIDQYQNLYLPAAKETGLKIMSEREYVALAFENFDNFAQNVKTCQALGHKYESVVISDRSITACVRCGTTSQLGELLIISGANAQNGAT